MSQMEFDFEQYPEPRRVDAPTYNEWLRRNIELLLSTEPKLAKKTQQPILSTDSTERKATPIFSGVLMYFPLAIAAVARHSKRGNDKHNKNQPLHWSREKSQDHLDCISRHLIDANHLNAESGEYEEACALAWRALANLQLLEERRLGEEPK